MTEAGFLTPTRTSPTAIALVVLLHGAAISALALSKIEVVRHKDGSTSIEWIETIKPPPEVIPDPPERVLPQPRSMTIDNVPPPFSLPPVGPTVDYDRFPPPEAQPTRPPAAVDPPADPPAPPRKMQPARARANLASYVSNDDYPAAAIRNEEQGITRFRLEVGADGRVAGCKVTASSGSSVLDSATCRLMRSRARFTPARDSSGNARSDAVSSAIHWALPD